MEFEIRVRHELDVLIDCPRCGKKIPIHRSIGDRVRIFELTYECPRCGFNQKLRLLTQI